MRHIPPELRLQAVPVLPSTIRREILAVRQAQVRGLLRRSTPVHQRDLTAENAVYYALFGTNHQPP